MAKQRIARRRSSFTLIALAFIVGLLLALPPVSTLQATTNLVENGSFEQPALSQNSFQYLGSIPGWALSEGTAIEVQNRIQGWPAAEGYQLVELDSTSSSGIYQDIPTTPGAAYLLRFAFSPRPGRTASDNVLEVNWNGARLGELISEDGSDLATTAWTYYTFTVVASSGASRLEFADRGVSNSFGAFVDDVSLTPLDSGNNSWLTAQTLELVPDEVSPSILTASVEQSIDVPGQSRWYKFTVQPGSKLILQLTNLPANYDLTLYKDIAAAFQELNSPQDLARLGAEFAPDAFSPDAFSPDAFSPDAFSPDAFSPDAFSPDAFSPDAFSPDAFSPDAFSPDAFSPDAFSPDAFSPDAFSPDAFSPDAFSPDAFSPDAFSPDAFSSAQTRSLIAVSAFEGAAGEGIVVNTWNNSGDFYVRVRGRNGAFSLQALFQLQVTLFTGACGPVTPDLPATSLTAGDGDYRTIILTDPARMEGTVAEKATLSARLNTFAARPEVQGVIVDVGADNQVAAANAQADANPECPFAKNLVAEAIKAIVDAYREANPLEYVVIVGNDNVIPFFRHPDQALLANEKNYEPPVRDATASQASLKLGFVLGQDAYGSRIDLSSKTGALPIPDLAVGRLVETASEATGMLDAYLGTATGAVTPANSLVTGYDFLEDAALAVQSELEAGGLAADTLIAARDVSPQDPAAWTASDLRTALLGSRHDLTFLAGHFSSGSALAADYSTRLLASEVSASALNLANAIIYSAGCHAGYNVVNPHAVPNVTLEPDWAQAFARKQATLIAGTGYQYGDTDFIEYSERLYLEFTHQLRLGAGPVPIGKALVAAKQAYLAGTPQLRGIHEKALLEATIFGLPMLSVNLPAGRINPPADTSIVDTTHTFAADPGQTLGLIYADVTVAPALTLNLQPLDIVSSTQTVTAKYLSGSNGVVANPAEPVLPLEIRNASVTTPTLVLRGIGFRGGSYTDLPDVLPLTGAATTEIRGVHPPFFSGIFYPVRLWSANYFGVLATGSNEAARLIVTPAHYRSSAPDSITGTLRYFDDIDFRLYYSDNLTQFETSGNTPALSAPPSIVNVSAITDTTSVTFRVDVTGDPSAGIQEVWVTYTGGPFAGQWQSLNLTQDPDDSTRWEGTLPLGVADQPALRYLVQAVNGVGLVALNTNLGAYYALGADPAQSSTPPEPTELALQAPPTSGAYSTEATFSARLTSNGSPLADQTLTFGLGSQRRNATTDGNGVAVATLPLLGLPGDDEVRASFAGAAALAASSDSSPFTITKQGTVLTLQPASVTIFSGQDSGISATLKDASGRALSQRSVFFIVGNNDYSVSTITDYAGRAPLGVVSLPEGTYSIAAYFSGGIPLPEALTLNDERYEPATATGSLTIATPDVTPPVTTASVSGTLQPSCTTNTFYAGNVTVTLTRDEPGATFYRVKPFNAAFGAWQTYTGPFVVGNEGTNTIEFYSVDLASNVEATQTLIVRITAFGATSVLDNFNHPGSIGNNWEGNKGAGFYKIEQGQVHVRKGGPIYWRAGNPFGAAQEAFVTLTTVDTHAPGQALLLKVQGGNKPDWSKGAIKVLYDSAHHTVQVKTFKPGNSTWKIHPAIPVTLNNGDQLGGQALADGAVRVYRNCDLLGVVDTQTLTGTFFVNKGGRIGLWFIDAEGAVFDNFGGGTITP
ncbi:MAG TPA: DUF642 domain-containing protein [Anaerolineae bacterium]|nr:DUF642 domain-containing protein [Anaerolineae bacterium]